MKKNVFKQNFLSLNTELSFKIQLFGDLGLIKRKETVF